MTASISEAVRRGIAGTFGPATARLFRSKHGNRIDPNRPDHCWQYGQQCHREHCHRRQCKRADIRGLNLEEQRLYEWYQCNPQNDLVYGAETCSQALAGTVMYNDLWILVSKG